MGALVTGVQTCALPISSGLGGIGNGGNGLNGAIGSAQTEKLETGLTLNPTPNFEANSGMVTVSFKLELTELIEFIKLNAGNQLGSFKIGRAHVCTPVTNAQLVCRLLLETNNINHLHIQH